MLYTINKEMSFNTYLKMRNPMHLYLEDFNKGRKLRILGNICNLTKKTNLERPTKSPLYLVVTDPSITIEYFNRNVWVVLYT